MWLNGKPPDKDYYAVIFSSTKSADLDGYKETDDLMMDLAQKQQGFLGYESAGDLKNGIFVSYWESMEAIEAWRKNALHMKAKSNAGKWYDRYLSQICKVEHTHLFER